MFIPIILERILDRLPMHAEEGRLRESLAEHAIISQLGSPDSATIVAVMRRIFESFSLLDKHELSLGNWAFVSFPAFLMARSLMAAWAVPEQRFVAEGYWEDLAFVEEQRILLHQLETGRKRFHPTREAKPIRFVHVAWGIIRLGNEFLMHHREDKARPDAKQYVFPGGRLRPTDYSGESSATEILRDLASENSTIAVQSLDSTLIRELDEELGLHVEEDYTFSSWRRIKPYCAVEGSGNKHALTHYEITLYVVQLTPLGESRLLRRVAADTNQYPWFSLDALAAGRRTDGAVAYIDALHADMGGNFRAQFASVPDATGIRYLETGKQVVVLPDTQERSLKFGLLGKEKDFHIPLSDFDWELLLFLGWCARSFSVQTLNQRALVLGGGWIHLLQEADLHAAKQLSGKLQKANLPLLQFSEDVFRLAVQPESIYFSDDFFSYTYEAGGQIDLHLTGIATRFADLDAQEKTFHVPRRIGMVVEAIHAGSDTSKIPGAGASDNPKNIQKQNLDSVTKFTKDLGLRCLIKMPDNKEMTIPVKKRVSGQM